MSIPLHLVTGFLGSGKTSFLKHYLETFGKQKKIAVVQNEFSSVNIDGREIQHAGDYKILEVNNGSVFCVCLLGSFIDSLAKFVDEVQPDELLMEASGMSDPIGVGQIFQSKKLQGKVYLGHVWSVIDAQNFLRVSALKNRVDHQLRVADTIIINKLDLAGDQITEIEKEVRKTNPFANVIKGSFSKVDLNNLKKALNLFPQRSEQGEGRPDLGSAVIKTSLPIGMDQLKGFLSDMNDELIRCKGFVKLTEDKTCFVQGVFQDVEISEVEQVPGPTELVIIGNFDSGQSFQSRFEKYCRS